MAAEEVGITLAAWLRRHRPGLTWSQARALCERGLVRVAGRGAGDPARRLEAGQKVEVLAAENIDPSRLAENAGTSAGVRLVRHFDRDVVVAAKPAGWLTLPFAEGDRDTLLQRVAVELRRAEKALAGGGPRRAPRGALRAVQRLDKETSGLVVFARTVAAQRALQASLAEHKLERIYWAVVTGRWPAAGETRIETFLLPDRGDGRRGSFRGGPGEAPPPEARFASTIVRPLGFLARGPATLLECRLETGRTHQIRIHLAERGHPVWGEPVYGRRTRPGPDPRSESENAARAASGAEPRLMLHARRLAFEHPRSHERLAFEEPAPPDFEALVRALGGWPAGVVRRPDAGPV